MRLEYQIEATGDKQLRSVFRSIEAEANRNAKLGATRDRQRVRSSHQVAKAQIDASKKAAKVEESEAARSSKKAATEKERAAKRAADAAIREARRVATEEKRLLAWRQRIQNKHFQDKAKDQARSERAMLRAQEATAKRVSRGFGGVTKGALGFAGRGLSAAAGVAGIGVGVMSANAVSTQMDESKQASLLANAAQRPGEKGAILKEAQNVKGISGGEALTGMGEFVAKTGNLDAARAMLKDMGQIALATGTDMSDLGATAGQAFNVIADQVEDPVERIKQLKSILGTLVVQGQKGAVEISDLARDFGKLGAATRAFEGDAPGLLRTMGAFAQMAVAKGGAESSADASTAAVRLSSDIVTHRSKFAQILGGEDAIKSETDPTKLKDPLEVMIAVLEKTGGDITKTSGLFGMESKKIFTALSATYGEAEKKQKGSGTEAVRAWYGDLAGAKMDEKSLGGMVSSRMQDGDVKYVEAMKRFNSAMGEQLLPVVTDQLIPALVQLTPYVVTLTNAFTGLVDYIERNPLEAAFTALGVLMLAEMAKAFVVAKGGAVVSSVAAAGSSALAGAGAAVAAGGAAGAALTVGAVTIAAGSVLLAGIMANDLFDQVQAEDKDKGFWENLNKILDDGAENRRKASEFEAERAERAAKATEAAALKMAAAADNVRSLAPPSANRTTPLRDR